jgi:hypothetical protein
MLFPLILLGTVLAAQTGPGVPQPPLHSDLLDQLIGNWDLTGAVRGQPVHERADAEWVLGHQFLRIHTKQIDGPVETVLHVGYDTVSERYVSIRLDSFSARGSETIGYGIRDGDKLQFTFEYPSGPLKETWSWDAKERTWQFLVESKVKGNWTTFSTISLRRVRGRGGPPGGPPPLPPQ